MSFIINNKILFPQFLHFIVTGRSPIIFEIFKIYSATMNQIESNFYRGQHGNDTRVKRSKQQQQIVEHRSSHQKNYLTGNDQNDFQELKEQNAKLKKLLKQAQAKRTQITKQCSEVAKKLEKVEEQNSKLNRKLKDGYDSQEGSQYRLDELRFLNKELNNEIESLRKDNDDLSEKVRYHTEILERKYQDLEERTFKRIQQALKRVKKGIHYLSALTPKEIQKTREIQVENLRKTAEILRGKFSEDKYEEEIEELMNPIREIQEQLHQRNKQFAIVKEENARLQQQVQKHKRIEHQLMPQYKESIEKLKKGLAQMRTQLSENEYQKCQLKKKYQQKIKELQIQYDEVFREHRRLNLQNKIYEKKLEEMEADVEEEKDRLKEENQLLKKLYKSDKEQEEYEVRDELGDETGRMQGVSYKTSTNFRRKNELTDAEGEHGLRNQRAGLKKNYSASNLRNSASRLSEVDRQNSQSRIRTKDSGNSRRKNYEHLRHGKQFNQTKPTGTIPMRNSRNKLQLSDYYDNHHQYTNEEEEAESGLNNTSQLSQESLKNQIFKIDKEIMEIQKTLNKELNMYK